MNDPQHPWNDPPDPFTLKENEIHVWRAPTNILPTVVDKLANDLSEDELARAERYHFERDQRRFTVCRGILRRLLCAYLETEPRRLVFDYGRYGKPFVSQPTRQNPIQFNLTHSGDLALFAFTKNTRIGIDLEQLRPIHDVEQICERFFTNGEKTALRNLPEEQKLEAFFTGWTRKEAYVKALGKDLLQALDQVEVSLIPGESARLINDKDRPEMIEKFSLISLVPSAGYLAAIALESRSWILRYLEFNSSLFLNST